MTNCNSTSNFYQNQSKFIGSTRKFSSVIIIYTCTCIYIKGTLVTFNQSLTNNTDAIIINDA